MAQLAGLSKRELDVVALVREGASNKRIAQALSISERTVEFHLKNIYAKLKVRSKVELALKLGSSTVASEAEVAENSDRLNLLNWPTALRQAVSKISKELNMENLVQPNARDTRAPLSFFEAISVCLRKYAEFGGRATRPEFWWFALFVTLVAAALEYVSDAAAGVFLVAALLPFLAAGARRLHDTGRSGWWQLYLLLPVAGFIILGVIWAKPSTNPLPSDTPAAAEQ